MTNVNCDCPKAINALKMTTNEATRFFVDFVPFIAVGAKVVGVNSITAINDAAGAPAVTLATYSSNGKVVSAWFDATGVGVVKRTYTFSIIVSVRYGSDVGPLEVRVDLKVC